MARLAFEVSEYFVEHWLIPLFYNGDVETAMKSTRPRAARAPSFTNRGRAYPVFPNW
jgi:hypothetical protein